MSMIRNYHNHTLRTSPQHPEECHRTLTVTGHFEEKISKQTTSLPFKMCAILELTLSTA